MTEPLPQAVYHKILYKDINPYSHCELEKTVFLIGSPGSGKTRFMKRLRDETSGKFVIDSGVFDLFQKHVVDYVKRKRKAGFIGKLSDFHIKDGHEFRIDPDFKLPNIDGIWIMGCLMCSIPLDTTLQEYAEEEEDGREICRNLPYEGWGAYHYRSALGDRITSGGKSGFPDWLFIPRANGKYVQVISIPGHHEISYFSTNRSIPEIPDPGSAIYLIDPKIDQFFSEGRENYALENVHIHLREALGLERKIPVQWVLSKTIAEDLEKNRTETIKRYNSYQKRDYSEITRRVPKLQGFDSIGSSSEEIISLFEGVCNNL